MKELKEEIAKGIPEFIHVFDERTREFVPAWLKTWKRQDTVKLINAVTFDNTLSSYTSKPVFTSPYSNMLLFFDVVWTLTPTNVQFFLEFSHDGADWHQYAVVPWSSLIYIPASGNKEECVDTSVRAPWMRIRAVATGVSAVNKVTVEVAATLNT